MRKNLKLQILESLKGTWSAKPFLLTSSCLAIMGRSFHHCYQRCRQISSTELKTAIKQVCSEFISRQAWLIYVHGGTWNPEILVQCLVHKPMMPVRFPFPKLETGPSCSLHDFLRKMLRQSLHSRIDHTAEQWFQSHTSKTE